MMGAWLYLCHIIISAGHVFAEVWKEKVSNPFFDFRLLALSGTVALRLAVHAEQILEVRPHEQRNMCACLMYSTYKSPMQFILC